MMATELLYLADTYCAKEDATVIAIGADERGTYLQTDRTIFYPQGGGQAADTGNIRVGDLDISVVHTGFKDGIVFHYTSSDLSNQDVVGKTAALEIDLPRRLANAGLHTAGHLISHVLETMHPGIVPVKGHHFPGEAYIEVQTNLPPADYIEAANDKLAEAISAGLPITAWLVDYETIASLRPVLAPFTPKDKPSRIVVIGDYKALPCGGTHVAATSELGRVRITKAKTKKDSVKISYELV